MLLTDLVLVSIKPVSYKKTNIYLSRLNSKQASTQVVPFKHSAWLSSSFLYLSSVVSFSNTTFAPTSRLIAGT